MLRLTIISTGHVAWVGDVYLPVSGLDKRAISSIMDSRIQTKFVYSKGRVGGRRLNGRECVPLIKEWWTGKIEKLSRR